jgi:cell wall-associated NlpC family hydrolase
MAKHALKPVRSTHNKMKFMVPLVVAGALLSSAAAAQADTGKNNQPALTTSTATKENAAAFIRDSAVSIPVVSAPITAKLSFERPIVKSTPAPPKPEVKPVAESSTPTAAPAVAATKSAPATPAAVAQTTAAQAATGGSPTNPANIPAAPVASTGANDSFGAKIAASAIAQANANVQQDCTALVSNSLRAVGINFHGWPKDYMQLGQITTNPQPGDLIYYVNGGTGLGHIAVYIGGGKAVHGGWEGHGTKVFSANVGSGPIYIHVNR